MTDELRYLVWTLVLSVVQILLPAHLRTQETGLSYNTGPRDVASSVPVRKITARLMRAQNNLLESLPIFIAAVLVADTAKLDNSCTYWGCALYFWARVVYVPLYALGVKYVRSLVWAVSLIGLLMVLSVLVHSTFA